MVYKENKTNIIRVETPNTFFFSKKLETLLKALSNWSYVFELLFLFNLLDIPMCLKIQILLILKIILIFNVLKIIYLISFSTNCKICYYIIFSPYFILPNQLRANLKVLFKSVSIPKNTFKCFSNKKKTVW